MIDAVAFIMVSFDPFFRLRSIFQKVGNAALNSVPLRGTDVVWSIDEKSSAVG